VTQPITALFKKVDTSRKKTMDVSEEKYSAFKKVHRDFENILKLDQCRSCTCLYSDMMGLILEAIKSFRRSGDRNNLAYVEKDFEKWLKEAKELNLHG
jgi:hypothetical protein